jgi:hypothetical protein
MKINTKILVLFLLLFPISLASPSGYSYRRQIKIDSKNLMPDGFTINLTLDTESLIKENKMNFDCSDLRIVDSNENEIDRLVEDCNSIDTKIYFKYRNYTDKYYLYYGNKNSVKPLENKSQVYYFYDDFEQYIAGQSRYFDGWSSNGGLWKIENTKSYSGNNSVMEDSSTVGWNTLSNNVVNVENFTYVAHGMIGSQQDVWSFGFSFNIQNQSGYRYQVHWEYQIGSGIGGWTFQLRKVLKDPYEQYPLAVIYPHNYSAYNIEPPEVLKWYEFKIVRIYPNIKVYINDKLIFDVNDSTFRTGGIGFSRYSNRQDSSRKSWYDDVIVMLYMEPWPEVYLEEEEEYSPTNLIIQVPAEIKVNESQEICFSMFQNFTPVKNLSLDDINISIKDALVKKTNLQNYNNGSYSLEIKVITNFLGKKKIDLEILKFSNITYSYITTTPAENSLIITDKDWKNYISAVSTGRKVIITNTSKLLDFYNYGQLFLLNTNISTEKDHYFIDRDTLYLIFFKDNEVIVAKEKDTAIASSMLGMPIITDGTETLELLKAKKIHNFSTVNQVKNYYFTRYLKTNYLILVNQDSEKSIFAAPLAFKHKGFIVFSSSNPDSAKQALKQAIPKLKYRFSEEYKFRNKLFLVLIDMPQFYITDPVDDGLIDRDGNSIETDNMYADINDDGYLDLSVARLEGSEEAITHQICAEASGKKALIISTYDTPRVLDIFYGIPLMRYSQSIDGYLDYRGFNTTRLVEHRSSQSQYSSNDIKSLVDSIRFLIEEQDFNDVINQIKLLVSTFNEAAYLLVEFDWTSCLTQLLNGEEFVLKHLPVYNEENLASNIVNKDIIIYDAFGNSTHWFTPNETAIPISSLPDMPSFVYLYYSNGANSLQELQKKSVISLLATTSSAYTPYSSYTSYLFFEKFNGEIGYIVRNAKNKIFSYYNAIRNISYNPQPYLKEYYSRTLYGDPAKVFDPYIELMQSEDTLFDDHLRLESFINPYYKVISNGTHNFAYFYDADFIDSIPVYKKTFLLPEDANIVDVSFYPEFKNESVYSEVDSTFLYQPYKLIDNRTALDVVVVPITRSGQIMAKLKIEIVYDSSIEITSLKAKDAKLEFSVYSDAERDANATVLVQTEDDEYYVNKSIHLHPGINDYEIFLPVKGYGKYSVSLIVEAEKIAGPKYTFFELKPSLPKLTLLLNKIRRDFSEFFISKKSLSESLSVSYKANRKIVNYKTADSILHAEIGEEMNAVFSFRGKTLIVRETADEKLYTLKTADGQAAIYFSKGLMKQTYTKPEILEELRQAISAYNEIMLKLERETMR